MIRIKISKNGHLSTLHGHPVATITQIRCPRSSALPQCGDWCPHFRIEPAHDAQAGASTAHRGARIHLCEGTIIEFNDGDLLDERE